MNAFSPFQVAKQQALRDVNKSITGLREVRENKAKAHTAYSRGNRRSISSLNQRRPMAFDVQRTAQKQK